MRKTRQRQFAAAVVSIGQNNAQCFRSFDGIVPESFVKITDPKEQNRVFIFCLEFVVLHHHRRDFLRAGRLSFSGPRYNCFTSSSQNLCSFKLANIMNRNAGFGVQKSKFSTETVEIERLRELRG